MAKLPKFEETQPVDLPAFEETVDETLPSFEETQDVSTLDIAVNLSNRILTGLGRAVQIVTTPITKAAEISARAGEEVTEALGRRGVPAPIAAIPGAQISQFATGVEAAKVPFKALGKLTEAMDKVGEKATEETAKRGVPPTAAAILGTIISMASDIAVAALPLKTLPKPGLAPAGKQIAAEAAKRSQQLKTITTGERLIGPTTKRGFKLSEETLNAVKQAKDLSRLEKSTEGIFTVADKIDRARFGPFHEEIIDPLLKSEVAQNTMMVDRINPITKLLKKHNIDINKESIALRRFAEGKIKAPPGKEKAYQEITSTYRKHYDELLDKVNKFNAELSKGMTPEQIKAHGLQQIPRRKDYVHHMRDISVADDLGVTVNDIREVLFTKKGVPKRGFEKHRFEAIPDEMLTGAVEAYESYVFKASRYLHQIKNVEKLRVLAREAKAANKPNLGSFLDDVGNRLTGEASMKSRLGAEIGTGGIANRVTLGWGQWLARKFSDNIILGNLSAHVAQVGAQMMASIYTGTGRALTAIPEGLVKNLWDDIMKAGVNPAYRSFAREHSKAVQLYEKQVVKSALRESGMVKDALVEVFNYINDSMVVGTFNQAFKGAIKSGLKFDDAVKTADQVAFRAQAIYSDTFKPAVISSSSTLGRLALPFQTYVFNAANMLKNDIIFAKMSPLAKLESVAQMASTGILLNLGTKVLTGRDKIGMTDLIPALRVAQMGLSGPFTAIAKPAQAVGALMTGKPGLATQRVAETAALFGPKAGGFQMLQTTRGALAIGEGRTDKPLRSLVFGPIKPTPRRRGRRRKHKKRSR